MKFKRLAWVFILSILVIFISSIAIEIVNIIKTMSFPNKDVASYIITIVGFVLTALGFGFVVLQVTALATQIDKQEEQYHKDSEFRNFLEATKMLTSIENKNNTTAQISAMYLLYDFAIKYPNNIEKVIHVLNRFPIQVFYPNKTSDFFPKTIEEEKNGILFKDKRIITEWKEKGNHIQQLASISLELVKKLFSYAIENKEKLVSPRKIDLSGIILFNFDIEVDIKTRVDVKLSTIFEKFDKTIFLLCNFSNGNSNKNIKRIYFSTDIKKVRNYNVSNTGKLDVTLSTFVGCDLTNCDFSYSNLWGASFEHCILNDTKFNQTECEGVHFIDSNITDEQIKSMLFLSKNDGLFNEFNKQRKNKTSLEYGVIYEKNSACFENWEEYKEFKNKKLKVTQKEKTKSNGIFITLKNIYVKRFAKIKANDDI